MESSSMNHDLSFNLLSLENSQFDLYRLREKDPPGPEFFFSLHPDLISFYAFFERFQTSTPELHIRYFVFDLFTVVIADYLDQVQGQIFSSLHGGSLLSYFHRQPITLRNFALNRTRKIIEGLIQCTHISAYERDVLIFDVFFTCFHFLDRMDFFHAPVVDCNKFTLWEGWSPFVADAFSQRKLLHPGCKFEFYDILLYRHFVISYRAWWFRCVSPNLSWKSPLVEYIGGVEVFDETARPWLHYLVHLVIFFTSRIPLVLLLHCMHNSSLLYLDFDSPRTFFSALILSLLPTEIYLSLRGVFVAQLFDLIERIFEECSDLDFRFATLLDEFVLWRFFYLFNRSLSGRYKYILKLYRGTYKFRDFCARCAIDSNVPAYLILHQFYFNFPQNLMISGELAFSEILPNILQYVSPDFVLYDLRKNLSSLLAGVEEKIFLQSLINVSDRFSDFSQIMKGYEFYEQILKRTYHFEADCRDNSRVIRDFNFWFYVNQSDETVIPVGYVSSCQSFVRNLSQDLFHLLSSAETWRSSSSGVPDFVFFLLLLKLANHPLLGTEALVSSEVQFQKLFSDPIRNLLFDSRPALINFNHIRDSGGELINTSLNKFRIALIYNNYRTFLDFVNLSEIEMADQAPNFRTRVSSRDFVNKHAVANKYLKYEPNIRQNQKVVRFSDPEVEDSKNVYDMGPQTKVGSAATLNFMTAMHPDLVEAGKKDPYLVAAQNSRPWDLANKRLAFGCHHPYRYAIQEWKHTKFTFRSSGYHGEHDKAKWVSLPARVPINPHYAQFMNDVLHPHFQTHHINVDTPSLSRNDLFAQCVTQHSGSSQSSYIDYAHWNPPDYKAAQLSTQTNKITQDGCSYVCIDSIIHITTKQTLKCHVQFWAGIGTQRMCLLSDFPNLTLTPKNDGSSHDYYFKFSNKLEKFQDLLQCWFGPKWQTLFEMKYFLDAFNHELVANVNTQTLLQNTWDIVPVFFLTEEIKEAHVTVSCKNTYISFSHPLIKLGWLRSKYFYAKRDFCYRNRVSEAYQKQRAIVDNYPRALHQYRADMLDPKKAPTLKDPSLALNRIHRNAFFNGGGGGGGAVRGGSNSGDAGGGGGGGGNGNAFGLGRNATSEQAKLHARELLVKVEQQYLYGVQRLVELYDSTYPGIPFKPFGGLRTEIIVEVNHLHPVSFRGRVYPKDSLTLQLYEELTARPAGGDQVIDEEEDDDDDEDATTSRQGGRSSRTNSIGGGSMFKRFHRSNSNTSNNFFSSNNNDTFSQQQNRGFQFPQMQPDNPVDLRNHASSTNPTIHRPSQRSTSTTNHPVHNSNNNNNAMGEEFFNNEMPSSPGFDPFTAPADGPFDEGVLSAQEQINLLHQYEQQQSKSKNNRSNRPQPHTLEEQKENPFGDTEESHMPRRSKVNDAFLKQARSKVTFTRPAGELSKTWKTFISKNNRMLYGFSRVFDVADFLASPEVLSVINEALRTKRQHSKAFYGRKVCDDLPLSGSTNSKGDFTPLYVIGQQLLNFKIWGDDVYVPFSCLFDLWNGDNNYVFSQWMWSYKQNASLNCLSIQMTAASNASSIDSVFNTSLILTCVLHSENRVNFQISCQDQIFENVVILSCPLFTYLVGDNDDEISRQICYATRRFATTLFVSQGTIYQSLYDEAAKIFVVQAYDLQQNSLQIPTQSVTDYEAKFNNDNALVALNSQQANVFHDDGRNLFK